MGFGDIGADRQRLLEVADRRIGLVQAGMGDAQKIAEKNRIGPCSTARAKSLFWTSADSALNLAERMSSAVRSSRAWTLSG